MLCLLFFMGGKTSSSLDRAPQGKAMFPSQTPKGKAGAPLSDSQGRALSNTRPLCVRAHTHTHTCSRFREVSCGGLPTRPSYPRPCHASFPPPSAPARPLAPSVPPRTFLMMSSSLPGTTPSCIQFGPAHGGAPPLPTSGCRVHLHPDHCGPCSSC